MYCGLKAAEKTVKPGPSNYYYLTARYVSTIIDEKRKMQDVNEWIERISLRAYYAVVH